MRKDRLSNDSKIKLGLIVVLIIMVVSLLLSRTANPDLPLFWGLKRIQEKVFLNLKPNPSQRVDYMSGLLDSRKDEIVNLVNNKSYNFILPSSLRYSTLAGQITDLIVANNLTDKVETIKNQFLDHKKALQTAYVIYPKNIPDNVEWKYIQDDINYLDLYLDKLSKI